MQFTFSSLLVFVLAAVTVQAAPVSKPVITITAPGATSVPAKADGCAHITPAGQDPQNVCAKSVTASGFTLAVTDLTTGAKTNCKATGTSGTCGATGVGATIGAAADAAAGSADAATDAASTADADAPAAATPAKSAKGKKAKKGKKDKKAKKGKKTAKGGAAAAASSSAVTITAPGAASVAAKPDGCAHITPEGANAQNVCAKSITPTGFKLTVTDLTTNAKSSCAITGTSGVCGSTGAGATVGAAATRRDLEDLEERATQIPAGVDITITAPGAKSAGSNHFGCADITPAGKNSQLVCTKLFTSKGFTLSVEDLHTKARTSCLIVGTSGTCGPSGAGAKLSSLPKREFEEDLEERATQVPAGVDITITAKGAKNVGANHFGCADIKPAGKNSQLVCTKLFTSKGFTLSVEDLGTKARTSCLIEGTSGTCGSSGAGATLSSLPKREFEEDVEERDF